MQDAIEVDPQQEAESEPTPFMVVISINDPREWTAQEAWELREEKVRYAGE